MHIGSNLLRFTNTDTSIAEVIRNATVIQELQEKIDLQQRDRKRAIAKLNRVSSF